MSKGFEMAAALTQRQRQALEILAKAERPLRNKDFHERFETDGRRTTGWAKALGPCTKTRDHDSASLWAQGLVTVVDKCSYTITALGREVAGAMGSGAIHAKVGCERSPSDAARAISRSPVIEISTDPPKPTPLADRLNDELSLDSRRGGSTATAVELERVIRPLTLPINGQYPRPWSTDIANPAAASVFVIGRNWAVPFPVRAVGSHDRLIDALFNRNGCGPLYAAVFRGFGSTVIGDLAGVAGTGMA